MNKLDKLDLVKSKSDSPSKMKIKVIKMKNKPSLS